MQTNKIKIAKIVKFTQTGQHHQQQHLTLSATTQQLTGEGAAAVC